MHKIVGEVLIEAVEMARFVGRGGDRLEGVGEDQQRGEDRHTVMTTCRKLVVIDRLSSDL
jgi:hypothetical protein